MKRFFLFILAAGLLAGCTVTPDTVIKRPLTATPAPRTPTASQNGAIFQTGYYRPMFEDRRARLPGDVITIIINEKNVADKGSAGSASKSGSASVAAPTIPFLGSGLTSNLATSANGSVQYADKGAASSSNSFTGTIAVTVIEVQANGNLVVAGEKQIAMDKGAEFIRFSGVVNPDAVSNQNTVSSLQVADAKVEYRSAARIDAADIATQFSRFFLSVLPF